MQTRSLNSPRFRRAAGVTVMLALALALLKIDAAAGRPDVRQSPFSLELQPPLLEAAADDAFNAGGQRAIDSYGNPIDALRPIDTPDGRKVVSAQGVQFEIPNYASGITEIRKPSDDLLPPHIDAIAVAETTADIGSTDNTDSTDSTSFAPAPATSLTPPKHESSASSAEVSVEVEQAQLVPLPQRQQQEQEVALPDYLLELQRQDKNIGGPVPWTPAPDGAPLSVIAWDLLPPLESAPEPPTGPQIITEEQPTKHVVGVEQPGSHNIRVSLSSGQGLSPAAPVPLTAGRVAVVALEQDGPNAHGTNAHVGSTTPRNGARFPNRHRGTVHYSTTPAPRSTTAATTTTSSTSTSTTTTTTTAIPSTTRRVIPTTTTTTTTPRPRTTPSTARTTPLDPSTFYKLDNEEAYAYTLPPWLQEVTDPDLDVAVTFIVPTDNDQYNHTLPEDLEPPFEPFVDLHQIQLTPPPAAEAASTRPTPPALRSTTSTTATTTTTRRPSSTAPPAPPATRTTKAPILKAHTTQRQLEQPQLITTTIHTAPPKTSEVTSTTPAPAPVDPNPFDSATLPPWLQDFDYPDVGPGVPYNPDNFKESPVEGGQKPGGSKPNDFQPHGFASPVRSQLTETTTSTSTSAPAETTSSAFPSKVTLPLPAISSSPELNTVEPPLVLIPPAVANSDEPPSPYSSSSESSIGSSSGSSSSSSQSPTAFSTASVHHNPTTNSFTHFAARFDAPISGQETQIPAQPPSTAAAAAAAEEQFPPFNGNAADSQKVEYTKSDEGKVISTPLSTQRKDGQGNNSGFQGSSSAAPPVSNTGKYTGGFGAPAGLLRPQTAAKPDIYVAGNEHEFSNNVKLNRARPGAAANANANGGRYTGGFGAPSGVLSPQNAPRPFQQSQQPQQPQPQPQPTRSHPPHLAGAAAAGSHQQSRFGGPPGILVPFDNVQRTGEQ